MEQRGFENERRTLKRKVARTKTQIQSQEKKQISQLPTSRLLELICSGRDESVGSGALEMVR